MANIAAITRKNLVNAHLSGISDAEGEGALDEVASGNFEYIHRFLQIDGTSNGNF